MTLNRSPIHILTTYNVDLVKGEKWKTEFSVNPHFALLINALESEILTVRENELLI